MYPFFYPVYCPMMYRVDSEPYDYGWEEESEENWKEEEQKDPNPIDGDLEYVKEYRMMRGGIEEEPQERKGENIPAGTPMGMPEQGGKGMSGFFQQGMEAMDSGEIMKMIQSHHPEVMTKIMEGNLSENEAQLVMKRIIEMALIHYR